MAQIAPVHAVVVTPEAAQKSEDRRDWAMVILFGGAIAMTIFAATSLYWIRHNEQYVFWLAMVAQVQLLVILSAFAGLLVKRQLKISKTEISIVDEDLSSQRYVNPQDSDVVRRGDVQEEVKEAVEEAVEEIPAVNVPTEKDNGSTNKPS